MRSYTYEVLYKLPLANPSHQNKKILCIPKATAMKPLPHPSTTHAVKIPRWSSAKVSQVIGKGDKEITG